MNLCPCFRIETHSTQIKEMPKCLFFPCLHQLCRIVCLSPLFGSPEPIFCALSTILLFTFWHARPRTCRRRVTLNTFGKPGFQRYTGDVIIRPQQESKLRAMVLEQPLIFNPSMLSLAHFANSTPSHKSSAKLCNSSSIGLARPSFLDIFTCSCQITAHPTSSNHRWNTGQSEARWNWPRTHRTPRWSARFFSQSISLAQTIGSKKISGHLASKISNIYSINIIWWY